MFCFQFIKSDKFMADNSALFSDNSALFVEVMEKCLSHSFPNI